MPLLPPQKQKTQKQKQPHNNPQCDLGAAAARAPRRRTTMLLCERSPTRTVLLFSIF
jgi:hypothetical protein